MRNYILFDDKTIRRQLLPLTFTRPIADLRIGIFTIRQKWETLLKQQLSTFTEDYLQEKFPLILEEDNVFINGAIIPNDLLVKHIQQLKPGECIGHNELLIAAFVTKEQFASFNFTSIFDNYSEDFYSLRFPEDIFQFNDKAIRDDFKRLTANKNSQRFPTEAHILGNELFIEEGAKVGFAYINTQTGPVYIGKNAEIMEGAMIRGPFAAGEGTVVKMGAKIYGATTLGPNTVVGGELKNCVFIGNSNKGHDGYLGDSVIGEWCNMGADTNNSNLKNNFGNVKVWSYATGSLRDTNLMKYGVIMADHTKTAINTMLNTGTVTGLGCSIATMGFPPKFVTDFSWLQNEVTAEFDFEKFCKAASAMMQTKKTEFNAVEKRILEFIFTHTRTHKLFY
ncbi:glucose-1-phosphate thymidylyltransferase [Solitalea longa]|uniref:Glucose-1-phosphate thymidylyltransferase n=1 Tax=Solitalea longa TaxID=2079460 RepID=A0A2S5A642_9SPHI|nr:putative sugar nucleotidyl transferase [Solitalea longa]POY37779.1 glucose-1-phosphate thymidylyltransferase [Solitalea longa]